MDANCQRMCHFGLSLPISLKPVSGIPSHLGHKTLAKKVCYCQSLPSNFVLFGVSYSVYWWVQSLQDIQDGVKFIWSHRCSILICHPFDCCKSGYAVRGLSNSSWWFYFESHTTIHTYTRHFTFALSWPCNVKWMSQILQWVYAGFISQSIYYTQLGAMMSIMSCSVCFWVV